jgi:lipopolysaccharide export LptBFGC system permease protein LptF
LERTRAFAAGASNWIRRGGNPMTIVTILIVVILALIALYLFRRVA